MPLESRDTLIGEDRAIDGSRKASGAVALPSGFGASDPRAAGFGQDVYWGSHDCRACEAGSAGGNHCCQPQGDQQSLHEVCSAAARSSRPLKAVQKASDGDECQHPAVTKAKDNQAVLDALTTGSRKGSRRIGVVVGSRGDG